MTLRGTSNPRGSTDDPGIFEEEGDESGGGGGGTNERKDKAARRKSAVVAMGDGTRSSAYDDSNGEGGDGSGGLGGENLGGTNPMLSPDLVLATAVDHARQLINSEGLAVAAAVTNSISG